MTVPPFPPAFITPFDLRGYRTAPRGFSRLSRQLSEPNAPADIQPEPEPPPLRARSVCLVHRPQSSRERAPPRPRTHPDRYGYSKKRFLIDPGRTPSAVPSSRRITIDPVPKQRKKPPPPPRTPYSVSVKTLSLPMTYLDENSAPLSEKRHDSRGLTRPRPHPRPYPSRGLPDCARSSETENRLLIQIGEAEQVSDFERILDSNAILQGRGRVTGGGVAEEGLMPPPRPRSHYSVSNASDTYHYLFQRHVDSVQGLIREYRASCGPADAAVAEDSILGRRRDEPLDLSEFYDDDSSLCEELHAVADRAIDEEVRRFEDLGPEPVVPAPTVAPVATAARNFRVNLSSLIVARGARDSLTPEPGERRASSHEDSDDDREWEGRIMSARSEEARDESESAVSSLARELSGVELERQLPTITLSDCSEQDVRRTPPAQSPLCLHLTVPTVESGVEARPPPA